MNSGRTNQAFVLQLRISEVLRLSSSGLQRHMRIPFAVARTDFSITKATQQKHCVIIARARLGDRRMRCGL